MLPPAPFAYPAGVASGRSRFGCVFALLLSASLGCGNGALDTTPPDTAPDAGTRRDNRPALDRFDDIVAALAAAPDHDTGRYVSVLPDPGFRNPRVVFNRSADRNAANRFDYSTPIDFPRERGSATTGPMMSDTHAHNLWFVDQWNKDPDDVVTGEHMTITGRGTIDTTLARVARAQFHSPSGPRFPADATGTCGNVQGERHPDCGTRSYLRLYESPWASDRYVYELFSRDGRHTPLGGAFFALGTMARGYDRFQDRPRFAEDRWRFHHRNRWTAEHDPERKPANMPEPTADWRLDQQVWFGAKVRAKRTALWKNEYADSQTPIGLAKAAVTMTYAPIPDELDRVLDPLPNPIPADFDTLGNYCRSSYRAESARRAPVECCTWLPTLSDQCAHTIFVNFKLVQTSGSRRIVGRKWEDLAASATGEDFAGTGKNFIYVPVGALAVAGTDDSFEHEEDSARLRLLDLTRHACDALETVFVKHAAELPQDTQDCAAENTICFEGTRLADPRNWIVTSALFGLETNNHFDWTDWQQAQRVDHGSPAPEDGLVWGGHTSVTLQVFDAAMFVDRAQGRAGCANLD